MESLFTGECCESLLLLVSGESLFTGECCESLLLLASVVKSESPCLPVNGKSQFAADGESCVPLISMAHLLHHRTEQGHELKVLVSSIHQALVNQLHK